jgi:4-amino-4-deoxy-L-arabinose transferase-like glycosyltransferase
MAYLWNHRYIILTVLLVISFFFVYRFLYIEPYPLSDQSINSSDRYLIFNQPDESVNYLFIRNFVEKGSVTFYERLSVSGLSTVHPRSTTVVSGMVAPIGFPGIIIIFGFILKFVTLILGMNQFNFVVVSLTPLFAVFTAFGFYLLVSRVFDRGVGVLSTILLLINPAWWYYASRPMQHHTMMIFFLVFALYTWVRLYKYESVQGLSAFYWALLWGLAVYMRPSEIVWLGSLFIFSAYTLRAVLGRREWWYAFLGLFIAVTLFFGTQDAVYGSIFASGYVKPGVGGTPGMILSGPQGIPILRAIILPFGFDLKSILINTYYYIVRIFYPWMIVTAVSAMTFVWVYISRDKKKFVSRAERPLHEAYIMAYLIVSSYILIYYGSWSFFDNLSALPSIGSSHVRYFLPIYVFVLPLVAWFLRYLYRCSTWGRVASVMVFSFIFVSSVRAVFLPFEGLVAIRDNVRGYYEWQDRVFANTPENAILVTRYADKYIYPHRRVIPGLEGEEFDLRARAIVNMIDIEQRQVYWYDLVRESIDMDELNSQLDKYDLHIGEAVAEWGGLELRAIELIR